MVLLQACMIRDKGVVEFIEAARLMKKSEPHWRFVLASSADYKTLSAISSAQLQAWQE